jgi:hypothetical protein
VASALNFIAFAKQTESTIYLANVKTATPTPHEPSALPESIRQIIEIEFPDLFPSKVNPMIDQ